MRRLDLTGKTFGRLRVLGFDGIVGGRTAWRVRCECGTEKAVQGHELAKRTRSCGCVRYALRDQPPPPPIPGARWVALTHAKFALVDEAEFDRVAKHRWMAHRYRNRWYAGTRIGGKPTAMHRLLIGAPPTHHVDHIDGDSLNNRRSNLRLCTRSQNQCNRPAESGRRFKGVSFDRATRHWKARVYLHGVEHWLGRFRSQVEAAKAYDAAARTLHGAFARTNF